MSKREIDQLEPYLDKRSDFTWLPAKNTNYYASELAYIDLKCSQENRDLSNIPDYLFWSICNFFLFFIFGIICIILSVRVREHRRQKNYATTLKISHRTLLMNIITTIVGICFLVTMLALLINKSSSNF